MTIRDWTEHLTEDERIAWQMMLVERDEARDELVACKVKFDRICDDIYLLSRTVRERNAEGDL